MNNFQLNPDAKRLEEIRAPILNDLKQVQSFINQALDTDISLIQAVAGYILHLRGKKLRPVTVMLSALALDYDKDEHIKLATILEFIHVATLLHDDVVDESTLRRGKTSANAVWGNSASVLVGDFLYTRSFELMVEVGNPKIFEIVAHATRKLSEGEVLQLMNIGSVDMTEEQYFNTIERKTAALFQAGAQMGAVIAERPDSIQQKMARFGFNLGVAFQLIDDYLDYAGDIDTIGKKVGDDLAEGKLTLPLIYARSHCGSKEKSWIDAAIQQPKESDINVIFEIVASSGALDYTIKLAREYSNLAVDAIEFLPESTYQKSLQKLAAFACERNY